MLDPQQDRRQLFDALRPPAGYQLDRAIGTTFSLDLLALLTVPLAFTLWRGDDEQGWLQDPLALLHGIREVAGRLCLFCQAGQISLPRTGERLFTYLEDSVFEVAARHPAGVFHPKVWLLRYTPAALSGAGAQPVLYRLLCLSRNLTFDQSWDTLLVLDGELVERTYAYSRNHPLGNFFAALPELAALAGRSLTPAALETVTHLSDEVRRVNFELPWWQADYEFLPLGLNGRRSWPFPKWSRRQLVVSPFVSPDFLRRMGGQASHNILISRLESVAAVPEAILASYRPVYVLDPSAEPETEEGEAAGTADAVRVMSPRSGLHAKLFICEYGRSDVQLFTGSANATGAAFGRNVEFLVKFTGKGAQLGIDKLLVEDKRGDREIRLRDLLQEYQPGTAAAETDAVQQRLEQLATGWQRQLARRPWQAWVSDAPPASVDETQYEVALRLDAAEALALPDNVAVRCWPISRTPDDAVALELGSETSALFRGLSFAALTSFFAFAVTVREARQSFTMHFVLNLPLHNAPAGRREHTLRALLDNRRKVLNYLLFLLADNDRALAEMSQIFRVSEGTGANGQPLALPVDLFESMVRALDRNPGRLDQIYSLVRDLQRAGQADLLPDDFDDIWQPIWEARQQLRPQPDEREPA